MTDGGWNLEPTTIEKGQAISTKFTTQETHRIPCFDVYTKWGMGEIRLSMSYREDEILEP
jgi:hypothetical protein